MATAKPSVAAYLDPLLYERLVEFKDTHCLRSLSQAVEVVLGEYFGENFSACSPSQAATKPELTLTEKVERLTANYEFLNQSILTLQQTLLSFITHPSQSSRAVDLNDLCSSKSTTLTAEKQFHDQAREIESAELHLGLRGIEVARRLNTSPSTLSRKRSRPSFQSWSRRHDPEKVAWVYSHKTARYYPSESSE